VTGPPAESSAVVIEGEDHWRNARSYDAGGPPAAGGPPTGGEKGFAAVLGRLEDATGGTAAGATPCMVGGGAGYAPVARAGGTNPSCVDGRLGIGLSGPALIRSDEPPTIAFGAGVRPAASDAVPGLRLSTPTGGVFGAGAKGWIGGGGRASTDGAFIMPGGMFGKRASPPNRCVSGAPPSAGRLAGAGGAGAPFSRCRCSWASASAGSTAAGGSGGGGADGFASERPNAGGRGGTLPELREGAAVVDLGGSASITIGRMGSITPPAASRASGSETRGGSGAFGLRAGMARAPAGGETSLPAPSLGGIES